MPARTLRTLLSITAVAAAGCSEPDPLAWLKLPAEVQCTLSSERFVLHTDFAPDEAERQRRLLEGMCTWLEAHWFTEPFERHPLRVLLFADEARMQRWNASHELPEAAGRYIESADLLVIDLSTGLGTALHELAHYYLRCTCRHPRTRFVEEGIASFFEKFLGHIDDDGRLELSVGYFHPGRYLLLSRQHVRLHVQDLWNPDASGPDYAAARSFMLFLHRRGLLHPFVQALRASDGDGREVLQALAGTSIEQLDREWHEWVVANPPVLGGDTMLVARATIVPTNEWPEWLAAHEPPLEFDDQQGIWRVRSR